MMHIKFYKNLSENNRIDKRLVQYGKQRTGTLVDETSMYNPTILFELDIEDLTDVNYMYIQEFNRYYFISDIVSVRNGLVRISANIDVLKSFESEIKNCTALVGRNTYKYNLYLNDEWFRLYSDPLIFELEFPNGLTGSSNVLVIGGV